MKELPNCAACGQTFKATDAGTCAACGAVQPAAVAPCEACGRPFVPTDAGTCAACGAVQPTDPNSEPEARADLRLVKDEPAADQQQPAGVQDARD